MYMCTALQYIWYQLFIMLFHIIYRYVNNNKGTIIAHVLITPLFD